jgi:hypothetical protein
MIISNEDRGSIEFKQVQETGLSTLRKSVDKTKTFVTWEGNDIPESIAAIPSAVGPYTHKEFLAILNTEEWTDPNTKV